MHGHLCYLLLFTPLAGHVIRIRGNKTVNVCGETFTEEQIVGGQANISEGVFLVGVNQKEQTTVLLGAAKEQLGWEPETTFANIGLFWGTMHQDEVLWFLRRSEVKYIEANCEVHAADADKRAAPPATVEPPPPDGPA
ncbi:unnamed protein product [Prorocentrum cordatum]|uniref:Uncharacterized protein n=1 Tax=Prorocentrum cordatum TaxID=2364126 RepID=A0ABN9Q003_9DINO|nr:unnamed protein product [Polarella glacialis]